jgi:hypothetical protein
MFVLIFRKFNRKGNFCIKKKILNLIYSSSSVSLSSNLYWTFLLRGLKDLVVAIVLSFEKPLLDDDDNDAELDDLEV